METKRGLCTGVQPGRWLAAALFGATVQLSATAQGLAAAEPAPTAVPSLAQLFARHLGGGRSDTEIHLSQAGPQASARTQALGDGSFSCHVSGLRLADALAGADHADDLLAFVLVHEVTHCQLSPHVAPGSDAAGAAGDAARLLHQLTMESVADARAVIELFRAGGLDAARRVVAFTLPQRQRPASLVHSTAAAVRSALDRVVREPASVATPAQAFGAALQLGQGAALQTFHALLEQQGSHALWDSPEVAAVDAELGRGFGSAMQAFEAGRFDNRAATLREVSGAVSAGDRHFFVRGDGSVRLQAVVSAEGAHRAALLAAQMAHADMPEQALAVQWLRRQGALDALSLPRTSLAIARMVRNFSGGSASRAAQLHELLGRAIAEGPPGQDLWQLLETAADRLVRVPAAG